MDSSSVNATLAAVTSEIATSFNRLSNTGINVREFPSLGGEVVAYLKFRIFCTTSLPTLMFGQ